MDPQTAPSGHCVASVDRQVEDCELELIRVDASWCEAGFRGDREANPVTQGAAQQVFDAGDQTVQIDRLRIEPLFARERQEALDQRPAALGSLKGTLQQRQ